MRLPEKEQTFLYDTYWSKIENLFRGSEKTFDAFVRDYIALFTKASKQEKTGNIYFAFRRMFNLVSNSQEFKLDVFLQKLHKFARYHAAFSIGTDAPDWLREPFAHLRRQVDVPATLVMRLFECYDDGTLSADQFVTAIGFVDSYVFRRAICGQQTRGYWQVFANLAYRINTDNPFESLSVGLALQRESYRFANDDEFRNALEERDIFGKRVCFDLLDRLENQNSKEPTNTTNYSIEHIMPQNEKLAVE